MASHRRIGTIGADSRTALLDAAEQIMRDEGYAAVTSRRVAAKAGLKPQLVHYYFRTMDDLFVALFRRFADQTLESQIDGLTSDSPLSHLLDNSTDVGYATLMFEFMALSNHRKVMRSEIARFGRQFRTTQVKIIETFLKDRNLSGEDWPSSGSLSFVMEALSSMAAFDNALGVTAGDAATRERIRRTIKDLEKLPSGNAVEKAPSSRKRAA